MGITRNLNVNRQWRRSAQLGLGNRAARRVTWEHAGKSRSRSQSIAADPEGSDAQAAAKIATLTRLKGIGANDATLLTHEIF